MGILVSREICMITPKLSILKLLIGLILSMVFVETIIIPSSQANDLKPKIDNVKNVSSSDSIIEEIKKACDEISANPTTPKSVLAKFGSSIEVLSEDKSFYDYYVTPFNNRFFRVSMSGSGLNFRLDFQFLSPLPVSIRDLEKEFGKPTHHFSMNGGRVMSFNYKKISKQSPYGYDIFTRYSPSDYTYTASRVIDMSNFKLHNVGIFPTPKPSNLDIKMPTIDIELPKY
jgi:hypothetical protein